MSGTISDVMHDLLNKLRIISQVKEGQKLNTMYGLDVYNEGWFNWLARVWNRDSKDECIRYIRDLYKSLQQSIETVINEYSNNQSKVRKTMALGVLVNAATELKSSVRGLDNLRKTYTNYPGTVAQLHGIMRDYVIVAYSTLMDIIPIEKLSDELRESITFDGKILYVGRGGLHVPAELDEKSQD